jgi:hypothetical protein
MTKDDHRRSNFKAKMIFERKGMPAPVVALKKSPKRREIRRLGWERLESRWVES